MNKPETGRFQWIQRMGTHQAFHTSTTNKILHWMCIPFQLFTLVKLLSLVIIYQDENYQVDLALILISLISIVYLMTELLAGTLMAFLLFFLRYLAYNYFIDNLSISTLQTLLLLAFTSLFLDVCHRFFEPKSRDNTPMVIAEILKTKNMIYPMLIFYYHLVEILLALNYRPDIQRTVLYYQKIQMDKFN